MTDLDETSKAMQSLAKLLDDILNTDATRRDYGFVLLVFDANGQQGSRTNYVSNCQRHDMIAAIKEVTARFEGQSLQSGRA